MIVAQKPRAGTRGQGGLPLILNLPARREAPASSWRSASHTRMREMRQPHRTLPEKPNLALRPRIQSGRPIRLKQIQPPRECERNDKRVCKRSFIERLSPSLFRAHTRTHMDLAAPPTGEASKVHKPRSVVAAAAAARLFMPWVLLRWHCSVWQRCLAS